jgi:Domain of unknown function (DUF1996)
MMRRLVLAALMTLASSTFADAEGIWTVKCPYSHTNNDDPIRFPGQVGASHTHDFLGNETTNALSTRKSMLNGSTTCGTEEDKAGYWVPALYKDGVKINPDGQWGSRSTREKFYYSDSQYTSSVLVEPFPPDFRMIQVHRVPAQPDRPQRPQRYAPRRPVARARRETLPFGFGLDPVCRGD